jgi:hypothetical protein
MKNNNERLIKELEAAQKYLFREEIPVIGRSSKFQCVINQLDMPLLPLLKSNAAEREKLKKRSVIYLFIKGACNKVNVVVKTFADAIEQEKQKSFYSLLYTIETMEDEEIITQEKIY